MRRLVVLLVAVALALGGCGVAPSPDAEIGALAEELADCPRPAGQRGERPALGEMFVEGISQWLRVEEVLEQDTESAIDNLGQPSRLLVVDPTLGEEPFEVSSLVNWSYWPGITWAADNGAETWLAIAEEAFFEGPNPVLFTMLVLPDGKVFFPGYCAQENIYEELHEAYGDDLDTVMGSAIGLTGNDLAEALGVAQVDEPAEEHVILNPEYVPSEVLLAMRFASLHLKVSRALGDDFTLCTKVPAGWNDCMVLDEVAAGRGYVVDAYLDTPSLEFWLMDGAARLDEPIAHLATLDLPAEFGDTDVALRVEVDFDFPDDPTEATVRLVEILPLDELDVTDENWTAVHPSGTVQEAP